MRSPYCRAFRNRDIPRHVRRSATSHLNFTNNIATNFARRAFRRKNIRAENSLVR